MGETAEEHRGALGPWRGRRFLLPAAMPSWNHGPGKKSRICPDPPLVSMSNVPGSVSHADIQSRMQES